MLRAASVTASGRPLAGPRGKDPPVSPTTRDGADGVARVVGDRRREARLAEHRLLALARDPRSRTPSTSAVSAAAVSVRLVSRGAAPR